MAKAKVRVLIVENEAIISMDLRYRLEALGYCVPDEIRSGEEAVEAASRLRPDVVLIDVGLSGLMNGVAAADEIRRRFNIPVVYLTEHADENASGRAKMTELSGYVLKPFNDAELRAGIETAIQ